MSRLDQITRKIDRSDGDYPRRLRSILGSKSPEKLSAIGNIDLLNHESISFCGSRNVSEKGLEAASLCARTAVRNGFIVVSGNARGVDRATHQTALREDSATILVLPEGIEKFRIAPELRDFWDWNRVLVISQFADNAIWRSYQAMERNRTIMALSCAMIVVESGEKGGTKAAGEDALRLKIPLFAVDYGFDENVGPGNRDLISKGAVPLKRSKTSGEPNFGSLIMAARDFCSVEYLGGASEPLEQQTLF